MGREYFVLEKCGDSGTRLCSYLPGQLSRAIFYRDSNPSPTSTQRKLLKAAALQNGWSETIFSEQISIYDCFNCKACLSVRLRVQDFLPTRHQKKLLRESHDLTVHVSDAARDLHTEHYQLYRTHFISRHGQHKDAFRRGDPPQPHERKSFDFIFRHRDCMIEIRDPASTDATGENRLISTVFADFYPAHGKHGPSMYGHSFFYDPEISKKRSLGTLAILKLIEYAKQTGVEYLYMGNWAAGSPKVDYKKNFHPLEVHTKNGWVDFDAEAGLEPLRKKLTDPDILQIP